MSPISSLKILNGSSKQLLIVSKLSSNMFCLEMRRKNVSNAVLQYTRTFTQSFLREENYIIFGGRSQQSAKKNPERRARRRTSARLGAYTKAMASKVCDALLSYVHFHRDDVIPFAHVWETASRIPQGREQGRPVVISPPGAIRNFSPLPTRLSRGYSHPQPVIYPGFYITGFPFDPPRK